MSRLIRLHSFLDRFEERLEMDCEQLKRQLVAQVDQQFRAIRENVTELRNRFGGYRVLTIRSVCLEDDPPVETVQLDQCKQEKRALVDSSGRDVPSTSTGRKRKSTNQIGNKQKKTRSGGSTEGSKGHICKFSGCGKSFARDFKLAEHERIHLNIKPFRCTWANCGYASKQRIDVVGHVRIKHFHLPKTRKQQDRLNIVDDRSFEPEQFVQVDHELAQRRLE